MKKQLIILVVAAISIPAFAETNAVPRSRDDREGFEEQHQRDNNGFGERKRKDRRREMTPEMKEKFEEHRLRFMEKTLKNIGVTEEQKAEIIELQNRLMADLMENGRIVNEERAELSKLQKEGASQDVLFAAIDELSAAQGEKMKILVRNQLEMKRILGEEKYAAFMQSARDKWREHGRRGPGLPPNPGLPPIPGGEKEPPPPPQS